MKGIHSHKKKKIRTPPTFWRPRQPEYPGKRAPRRMERDLSASDRLHDNTRVFTVSIKADQHDIKPAEKQLSAIDMAKVNTLTRPGREKQPCVPPDYDDLDVTNEIGII
ncbi:60S ribosomal protein L23a [Galemys pyrenaicus]|uniref:60S ribosomal protein L23a n=1 Tax=Galemys pyrenaicus TaxID=202257 RepID=A0A8J6DH37_GALPY|nr:60S ribosomal protein L23a [Galemys pyrenaicus]